MEAQKLQIKVKNFFEDKPYIDYLIHQEGEISFTGLLQSFVGMKEDDTVPGISINKDGKTLMTGPSQRIMDLSAVPSPYTMGLFDHLPEMYPGKIWNAVLETNRGCPFMCTFCDWGGTTFSKVKKFGSRTYTRRTRLDRKTQIRINHKHRCQLWNIF